MLKSLIHPLKSLTLSIVHDVGLLPFHEDCVITDVAEAKDKPRCSSLADVRPDTDGPTEVLQAHNDVRMMSDGGGGDDQGTARWHGLQFDGAGCMA